MKRLFRLPTLFAAIALLGGGVALAQVAAPKVATINPTDLVQVVPNGAAGAGNVYATPAQLNGPLGYVNGGAATTGFTHTFGNSETDYFIQPAGTLATGTLTTAPSPSDGQRECFLSTQTQTAITWTANTGQSLSNAPTAGVANTPQCMTYSAASATWYRSP